MILWLKFVGLMVVWGLVSGLLRLPRWAEQTGGWSIVAIYVVAAS